MVIICRTHKPEVGGSIPNPATKILGSFAGSIRNVWTKVGTDIATLMKSYPYIIEYPRSVYGI